MSSYIGKIKIDSGNPLPIGSTLYGIATAPATGTVMYTANSGNLANADVLIDGLTVHIRFPVSNTYTNPTLKVGSFEAKPIHRIAGTVVGTTEVSSWPAGAVVSLTYDSTIGTAGAWVINSSTDVNTDTTYTISTGTANGKIKVTPSVGSAYEVSVYGLGSAAYTNSDAYATATQGTKADNAMPKAGGEFTGNVSFASGKTLTVQPIDSNSGANEAANKKYVDDAISNVLGSADAMIFKGILDNSLSNDNDTTHQYRNVPTNGYSAGWTYRINHAGTYASKVCEVGDLVIAIKDGPSSGSSVIDNDWTVAQTNIDGAVTTSDGADGYLAKFTGTHTIAKLVAISNNGTGFLKQDGSWATPTDTRDPGYGQVTIAAKSTAKTALTEPSSAVTVSAINPNEILKITPANKWITITGTNSNTADSDEIKFAHYVPSSITNDFENQGNQTGTRGSTFKIPKVAIDEAGHVTGITTITVSLPASDNTDEKVKQSPYSTATNSEFNILFKHSTGDTEETQSVYYSTVTNNKLTFNPSTGTLSSTIFSGTFSGTLATADVQTALGVDNPNATPTSTLTFLHKTGTWKTLSISSKTIASVSNGVLTLASTAADHTTFGMS